MVEKPAFADGQIGNKLLRGTFPGGAPINDLATGVSDGLTDAVCNLVGANFVRAAISDNNCLRNIDLSILKSYSYKCYCEIFNRQSSRVQECLSTAAAEVKIDVHGIIKTNLLLFKCCRTCADDKSKLNFKIETYIHAFVDLCLLQNPVTSTPCLDHSFKTIFSFLYIDFGSEYMLSSFFAGHNLLQFGLSNEGLIGGLLSGLTGGANQAVCKLVGSNFLQLLLGNCRDCLDDRQLSSFDSFCPYYFSEIENNRKCIDNGAAKIQIESVLRWTEIIGYCCTGCTGKG